MTTYFRKAKCVFVLVLGGLMAPPAFADPPEWAKGKGKGKGNSAHARSEAHVSQFNDSHGVIVREYYTEQYQHSRKCPPGLAKKNNGCMPPGQAKKWQVGRPLPAGVTYYQVPQPLVVKLGAPPSGHRYVRVGGDILIINVGNNIVVDAIQHVGG